MSNAEHTIADRKMVGRYRLLAPLGHGGFSTVFRAEHMSLGNEVALKLLNESLAKDETFARRFRREARRMVLLDHPNIVRVLDLDEVDGQLFIAMEYVPSKDLRQLLAEEKLLPLDRVVSIVRQLGSALDYAHRRGLIHRDVKPGNVLVRADGVVKLTDFGLVKAAEGSQLTQTGTTLGTPAYMSPEQTRGEPVDARADLYALGVMAYEFVTGRVPFQGDTPVSVVYMHVHETPPLPSTFSQRAAGPIEPVLLKALAKDPEERYQTGSALADALAAAVYELEDDSPTAAYDHAVSLFEARRFDEALEALKVLQATQPDYRDVNLLIARAQERQKLAGLYQQASQHLTTARELATQIASADPDFPDTEKVLRAVIDETDGSSEEDALAEMFDAGLAAQLQGRWLKAKNSFNEVVEQKPDYTRSGQRAADLLVIAKTQLASSRKTLLSSALRYVGRALIVLVILFVILGGLHLLLVRPAIEEAVFHLVEPTLDPIVEAEVFRGARRKCVRLTEKGINDNLADDLRNAGIASQVELILEQDTILAQAELGKLSASIGAKPEVIVNEGLIELSEFRASLLVQLFFSKNGLRNFVEEYINGSILRDGNMWLEELTIGNTSLNICVIPRPD